MDLFRSPPNPRRTAAEIATLVVLVVGLVLAYSAPSADGFVRSRRDAIGLACNPQPTPEQTRHYLGLWLFKHAVETPSCAFAAAPPGELSAEGGLLLSASLALVLGFAIWAGARRVRLRLWPRGALFGGHASVVIGGAAAIVELLALGLRYRLFKTHETVAAQFGQYSAACQRLSKDVADNVTAIKRTHDEYCRGKPAVGVCKANASLATDDDGYMKLCGSEEGRSTELCNFYRIHISNREKLIGSLRFDSCSEVASAQPMAQLAPYLARAGMGHANPVPPDTTPVGSLTPSGSSSASNPAKNQGGPTTNGQSQKDSGDDDPHAGGTPGGSTTERKTIETVITEVKAQHPELDDKTAETVAKYMMLGLPLPTALVLALLGGEGKKETVSTTRQRIVTEVVTSIAKGGDPRVSTETADEIAEKARRDPTLLPVLSQLPQTAKVRSVKATLSCGKSLLPSRKLCESQNGSAVLGELAEAAKSCESGYDQDSLAHLACCKCSVLKPGCGQFRDDKAHRCE